MPSVYVDRPLKNLIRRRCDALSDPATGEIVSERDAILDMFEDEFVDRYERRAGLR